MRSVAWATCPALIHSLIDAPCAQRGAVGRGAVLSIPDLWHAISRLGAAGTLLPTAVLAALCLRREGQAPSARLWLVLLLLAALATLASKLAFFAWGVGSARFDFTGVSGHALLATAILPVLGNGLLVGERQPVSAPGVALGALLAAAVGVSRVVLGAHSWSEVVAAWAMGAAVSVAALATLRRPPARRALASRLAPLLLLLALATAVPSYLPTHDWVVALALSLSGRAQPYVRGDLRRSPAAPSAPR